jgi:hypothetical protein
MSKSEERLENLKVKKDKGIQEFNLSQKVENR